MQNFSHNRLVKRADIMWFTETPWPPIFIGIAAILLLLSAWTRLGKAWCLIAAIVLGAACVGIFFLERVLVTDLEVVEAEVPKLLAAVEADDVERVVAFIHRDHSKWRVALEAALSQYRIEKNVRLTDLQTRYAANGVDVITHFRANGVGVRRSDSASHHIPTRWELTWKKIGEAWKIVHIQRLHPLKDEKIEITAPPG